ncbi:selenide, water dikinase SelD [uncultured Sphaerochaeta sp.]|uniref:selenide, water dikinase SelD n=1 Tax=uncultured Sphaerochaeta sp. TaxID=886478 RepID=UPI002A0A7910|nr:selenide, water dikinase SelD [uncultured Sphaerochaeta sp.]
MVKLTSMVKTSGCAAKLPPAQLHEVLESLPSMHDEHLVGGFENSDDALVYRLDDGTLVIQTVDFFPPMVDDPYTFGQVAAANALSDIYAMGSEPKIAMNLMMFPSCLDLDVMRQILLGGLSKATEAGAVIAGGHTISDPTPKYGLCVTGFAKEGEVWANKGAQEGDLLVLTKSLGVGIINTAVKAEMACESAAQAALESMTTLNKRARDEALSHIVHAATDITGFSLLGHCQEMAVASEVQLVIESEKVPVLPYAEDYANLGLNPEGMYNNRDYIGPCVDMNPLVRQSLKDVLFDPQTSGGLLFSMPKKDGLAYSKKTGFPIIGYVQKKGDKPLLVM